MFQHMIGNDLINRIVLEWPWDFIKIPKNIGCLGVWIVIDADISLTLFIATSEI